MVSARVFALLALASSAFAASTKKQIGEPCDISNNHLDSGTWNFVTDCDQRGYCSSDGICKERGCRRDVYPIGYAASDTYQGVDFDKLPPLCPQGQFCPDEMDHCMPQNPVGGPCQKDRDEQCAPHPDNWKQYSTYLNTNGSICLNFQCYYANVTAGQPCVNENTLYQEETDDGRQFAFIISRDNCINGFYCDGSSNVCVRKKHRHDKCSGNKECFSYNCQADGTCGKAADEPLKPQPWVYVVIGLAIVILIVGVLTGLWFLHRRWREENQVKLQEYYNEQIAYRQSIMSMSHAKNSLLSLPAHTTPDAALNTLYQDESTGYTTARANADPLLPPNMRREVSGAYSDDSDLLLVNNRNNGPRFRG